MAVYENVNPYKKKEKNPDFGIYSYELRNGEFRYFDTVAPTGTLTCDLLNFPDDVLLNANSFTKKFKALCDHIFQTRKINLGEFAVTIKEARELLEKLQDVKPFSYIDKDFAASRINNIFLPENIENVSKPMSNAKSAAYDIFSFLSGLYITMLTMGPRGRICIATIDKIDIEKKHSYESYSDNYNKILNTDIKDIFSSAIGRVGITPYMKDNEVMLCYHFTNYSDLFKFDFHTGLKDNHIPVKCGICGKYFLSTDNRATKYCNDIFKDDKKMRTCRQIANAQGVLMREKAEDNPRIIEKNAALERVRYHKRKTNITPDEAKTLSEIIERKFIRAATDNEYFNNSYHDELKYNNLLSELRNNIVL